MKNMKSLLETGKNLVSDIKGSLDSKGVKSLAMAVAAGALQVITPACGGPAFESGLVTTTGDGGADAVDANDAGEGGADAQDAGKDGADGGIDAADSNDAGEGGSDAEPCTVTVVDESPNGGAVNKGAEVKMVCAGVTPTCEATLTTVIADEMYYGSSGIIASGKAWVGGDLVQGGVNGVNVGAGDNKFVFTLNKPLPANTETIVCTGGDVKGDAEGGAHQLLKAGTNPENNAAAVQGKSFSINF